MICFLTVGTDPLLLDRQMVARFRGHWHVKDLMVWKKLRKKPKLDLDMTQRWFCYSNETMERVRAEALL